MTSKKLYEQAEKLGCQIPITKTAFCKVDIPKKVLKELTESLETINTYREDFPDVILQDLRDLGTKALVSVYKKWGDEWPSIKI